MNKKTLSLILGLLLVDLAAALAVLLSYAANPSTSRLLVFGLLVLAVPVILVVGSIPVLTQMRRLFNERSTQISNLEQRLSDAKSSLTATEKKLSGTTQDVVKLGSSIDANSSALKETRLDIDSLQSSFGRMNGRITVIDDSLGDIKNELGVFELAISQLSDKIEGSGSTPAEATAYTESLTYKTEVSVVRLASMLKVPLATVFSEEQAVKYLHAAADHQDYLSAIAVVREFPEAPARLPLNQCRALMKGLRQLGYLAESVSLMKFVAVKSGKPGDAEKAVLFQSELEMYKGFDKVAVDLPEFQSDPESTTVLHFVGKALPETQTGYTLRTHYTVEAQQRLGVEPVVVAQTGAGTRAHEFTETYTHKGIRYFLLGGPQRNSVPWDEWFVANIKALAETVRQVRPAILHAHSDFLNAMVAQYVGDAYAIPVVNETRGFWEESWLSRRANAEGWQDLDQIEQLYGLPGAYTLRKEREIEYRSKSSAVVTLASVMQKHIEELAETHDSPVKRIAVVPNAVDGDAFPVPERNVQLLDELDVPEEATVIGYISSIVEYEGIDVLVRAFFELATALEIAKEFGLTASDQNTTFQAIEGPPSIAADTTEDISVGEIANAVDSSQELLTEIDSIEQLRSSLEASSTIYSPERHLLPPFSTEGELDEEVDGVDFNQDVLARTELAKRLSKVHPDYKRDELVELADELLASVKERTSKNPVRLLIVGSGAELPGLRTLANELGIHNLVTFTGRVPHEQVLDYYSIIDLFVVPRKPAAVTELVTPLKPFEAMSTGRPCIFSDVAALAEIATQSQAAATFIAGSHHSLALTISALLSNPAELARMSEQGASWVRDMRTWDINSVRYLEIYNSLGLPVQATEATYEISALNAAGLRPAQMIRQMAAGPTPEPTGWFNLETKNYTAADIMENGWRIAKHPAVKFTEELDWGHAGTINRSWGFHLHAWEFMDPVLQEFYETGDESLLRWMLGVVEHWWKFVSGGVDEDAMVWYDMSLSLRMPRLARLLLATAKSPWRDEAAKLLRPAIAHVDACLAPEAFNQNNNHGFFAAAASLDYSKWLPMLPKSGELHDLGAERMAIMASKQFAADGGHLEHSPDYHRMLLSSFESALSAELIDDPETRERVERAAYVIGWMVQPDGHLVQFGDSPSFDVDAAELESLDVRSEFILTNGTKGEPATNELLALPESGYAFVRSPQPQSPGTRIDSSYLAFQAAFHSRAHKHADDLTFTWFDRGCELLVDSGRFGYIDLLPKDSPDRLKGFYYSAPERQYVESTRAHNTVEVNGEDIERRARKPYGSALGECRHENGVFTLEGEVDHGAYLHQRVLAFSPSDQLKVIDNISVSGEPVEVIAWFNMDGSLDIDVDGNDLLVTLPEGRGTIRVQGEGELISPVRGQDDPMRGWRSRADRELEPVWNFGFRGEVRKREGFTTVFKFLADSES